jgi:multidrug transporter EmrE-like cation transporter
MDTHMDKVSCKFQNVGNVSVIYRFYIVDICVFAIALQSLKVVKYYPIKFVYNSIFDS